MAGVIVDRAPSIEGDGVTKPQSLVWRSPDLDAKAGSRSWAITGFSVQVRLHESTVWVMLERTHSRTTSLKLQKQRGLERGVPIEFRVAAHTTHSNGPEVLGAYSQPSAPVTLAPLAVQMPAAPAAQQAPDRRKKKSKQRAVGSGTADGGERGKGHRNRSPERSRGHRHHRQEESGGAAEPPGSSLAAAVDGETDEGVAYVARSETVRCVASLRRTRAGCRIRYIELAALQQEVHRLEGRLRRHYRIRKGIAVFERAASAAQAGCERSVWA